MPQYCFLFLKNSFSLIKANYFTILSWFLPYTDVSQPQVYMWPPVPNPSSFPPRPIPLGCPSGPAVSALLPAANLDWSSVLHRLTFLS